MVQQIEFIIHTNIQPLDAIFFTQGQGQRFKKMLVNVMTFLKFLREVTHEYRDHMIRFSAFHR